jgi:hypothetical protein
VNSNQAAFTFRAISTVAFRSCLRKLRSDGVSILDTNKASGFAFGEAGEIVLAGFEPPDFELRSMFVSQSFKRFLRQGQFGRVGATRQASRTHHLPAVVNNMTAKIRQSAALSDEVIYEEISLINIIQKKSPGNCLAP